MDFANSGRPTPHRAGELCGAVIPAGIYPEWIARVVFARLQRVADGWLPTFEEIHRLGGFTPLQIVDFLAGGTGDGKGWAAIEALGHSILYRPIQIVISGWSGRELGVGRSVVERSDVASTSNRSVPHGGQPVEGGAGIAPGSYPEWLARIVYARLERVSPDPVPSFDLIHEHGGFWPLQILDLIAGGTGDGLGWIAIEKGQNSILHRPPEVVRPGR